MKIIHIGWYCKNPLDGVGKTILEQTRALSKAGVDIEIWHIGADCTVPRMEDVGELFPVWKLPAESSTIKRALRLPTITEQWICSRISDVDIIHLHSVFTAHNCHVAKLARKLGIPYVITPNGGWNDIVLQGRRKLTKMLWIYFFERELWSRAAFIQGVSHEEIRQLQGRSQMATLKHIPNGTAMPEKCSDISERNSILYIGRYDIWQKGLDVFCDAIKILVESGINLPKVIIAGPDYRNGRKFLEDFLINNRLQDVVELRGPVKGVEKDALFLEAMIFIHTSRWEGLPLTLLEALSYGIPCLLTPGTNVSKEWQEAGCAFEVPFDKVGISVGLERVLKMNLTDASIAATNLVSSHYSWSRIGAQLIDMYSLVKSSTSSTKSHCDINKRHN
jgi:glycosyltransferase involved in cell wall biosynthesis